MTLSNQTSFHRPKLEVQGVVEVVTLRTLLACRVLASTNRRLGVLELIM